MLYRPNIWLQMLWRTYKKRFPKKNWNHNKDAQMTWQILKKIMNSVVPNLRFVEVKIMVPKGEDPVFWTRWLIFGTLLKIKIKILTLLTN